MSAWRRWWAVVLFAIGMAYVEAASVVYIRTAVGRVEPYQRSPLVMPEWLVRTELVREAATMVMLAAVGVLAGRSRWSAFGSLSVAFGVWDIFYYIFLRPICGWPKSLLDWDVLFLIPLPWWGPVLSPTLIALLMIAGGTLLAVYEPTFGIRPTRWGWLSGALGVVTAIYVFMTDAISAVLRGGSTADLAHLLPERFNWLGYGIAWGLMAGPVIDLGIQVAAARTSRAHENPAAPQMRQSPN